MDNQANKPLTDLTGGDPFFKWMNYTILDKILTFLVTPAIFVGLFFIAFSSSDFWSDEDLIFAYGCDIFFGVVSMTITQHSSHSKIFKFAFIPLFIANFLCVLTFFLGWRGFAIGMDLVVLVGYWGGFYFIYKLKQQGRKL